MSLNIENFKRILKKTTLNYTIPSVSLNFDDGKIWTKMMSPDQNSFVFIKTNNNVIDGVSNYTSFTFSEPNRNVKPFLDLVTNNEVECKVDSEKITIIDGRQKSKIFFCSEDFVSTYGGDDPSDTFEFFHELEINDDVLWVFNKISKIASKFNKIYFTVENKELFIEATDKENPYSNGIKYSFGNVDFHDISLTFPYKYINSILSVMDDVDFVLKFVYKEDQDAGLILFQKLDNSEKYFLLSKIEE